MYQNLTSNISQSRRHTSSIFMPFSIKSGTLNSKMKWKPEPEVVFHAILAKTKFVGFRGFSGPHISVIRLCSATTRSADQLVDRRRFGPPPWTGNRTDMLRRTDSDHAECNRRLIIMWSSLQRRWRSVDAFRSDVSSGQTVISGHYVADRSAVHKAALSGWVVGTWYCHARAITQWWVYMQQRAATVMLVGRHCLHSDLIVCVCYTTHLLAVGGSAGLPNRLSRLGPLSTPSRDRGSEDIILIWSWVAPLSHWVCIMNWNDDGSIQCNR